jgi:hypothetical protein
LTKRIRFGRFLHQRSALGTRPARHIHSDAQLNALIARQRSMQNHSIQTTSKRFGRKRLLARRLPSIPNGVFPISPRH